MSDNIVTSPLTHLGRSGHYGYTTVHSGGPWVDGWDDGGGGWVDAVGGEDAATNDIMPRGKQSNGVAKVGARRRPNIKVERRLVPEAVMDVGCADADDAGDTSWRPLCGIILPIPSSNLVE